MKKILFLILIIIFNIKLNGQNGLITDKLPTSKGQIEITFIGHASLMFKWDHKVIYVDPWLDGKSFESLPKADIILITHDHYDHLDTKAIDKILKSNTQIYCNKSSIKSLGKKYKSKYLTNGSKIKIKDLKIEAVPAYNIVNKQENGQPYHTKGEGNGYVISFKDKKVYVAGDTENIPEMKNLKNIDIAFLPMNLPYTMTPEMVVNATKMIKPKVLYPYHTGNTDLKLLQQLMKTDHSTELRIRNMN